jgi:hypothetical protein
MRAHRFNRSPGESLATSATNPCYAVPTLLTRRENQKSPVGFARLAGKSFEIRGIKPTTEIDANDGPIGGRASI